MTLPIPRPAHDLLDRVATARDEALEQPTHGTRLAAILGIALGISFTLCFLTGLYSHWVQYPPSWFTAPARPAGLYRVTQGVHIATGIASIPLLLAKLWTVFPHLLTWPPVKSVSHAMERIALLPLVAGSTFLLFSGTANIDLWYPYPFYFPAAHYYAAWITIGALIVHIGAKIVSVRSSLGRGEASVHADGPPTERRRFLGLVGAGSGLLTVATLGQTVRPLDRLSILAPRSPSAASQGLPINKTADEANVVASASDVDSFRLVVDGDVATPLELTLDDLRALPQTTAALPLACVEGWSADATWRGVAVRDLLHLAGAAPDRDIRVQSLQSRGLFRASRIQPPQAADRHTLLALEINGEELNLDHGFPCRLIGPNRPGVMQTKWVTSLTVEST